MEEDKEVSSDGVHEVCDNPCAGTGCKDKKFCVPAGDLGCES
jgi:hypothetical protein